MDRHREDAGRKEGCTLPECVDGAEIEGAQTTTFLLDRMQRIRTADGRPPARPRDAAPHRPHHRGLLLALERPAPPPPGRRHHDRLLAQAVEPAQRVPPRRRPPSWLWATDPDGFGQVGCVYTAQRLRPYHRAPRCLPPACTAAPGGRRPFAADLGAPLDSLCFVLRDRDTKYTDSIDAVFKAHEMDVLLSAPQAPRMNAHCERVIGTVRREALDHVLIMNEAPARQVLSDYQDHYNRHRPHRSRDQRPPQAHEQPAAVNDFEDRRLLPTRVLGGVINEYRYAA
ncbi:integrase core domain-containing protein [Streptomyces sp. NPDC050485]|uniref:integrase core domain-containing protein n=1 Tax=Streptomyces sp. NPDC050485 TaxID=3365617 RepID=UPI003797989D